MDGQRFDALARLLAGGLPRRGALKTLTGAALIGAATRANVHVVDAAGNHGDHCNDKTPCKSPLVCINTECDHCRAEGDVCQTGWCCKGTSCVSAKCVKCSHAGRRGVVAEGCKSKKKKKRKKKH